MLYTDTPTVPVGGFLSVFGFFSDVAKVMIGTADCTVVERKDAVTAPKTGVKMIRVKVPAMAVGQYGVSVTQQSDTGAYFTDPLPLRITAGRVLYVSLTGNDSTAAVNDPTKPWRNLQTASRGGAHATMRAGDQVVIRGGNWSDVGFDGAWLRFRDTAQQGNANAYLHITGMPGEDVHYSTPAGVKGGIHGPNSAYAGTTGDFVAVSHLRIDVNANATSDAGPINLQYALGAWWVTNNALGPWPSAINSKAAGVAGHGDGTKVRGNHIFGMGCTGAQENHGIYVDSGGSNWEIGYNWVHDITGGNLIQFFDNVGLDGNNYSGMPANWHGFANMQIHHNWLEECAKYGLNMADGLLSGRAWGNVVIGATFSGLRVNTISKNMAMVLDTNVFYDNDRVASGSGNAQVLNTWGNYNPTGTVKVNANVFAAGPRTIAASVPYDNTGDADGYLQMSGGTYYANGHSWTKPAKDATAVMNAGAMPATLLALASMR